MTGIVARRRSLAELAELIDVPVDVELLDLATTHRSYAYEHGGVPHNERLEFLGDSVLGVVVTEALYRDFPDLPEGQLAKLRAAVVNARALADIARTIGLGGYLLLGRGEEATGGRDKTSILADATEAVIGAVFLSPGGAVAAGELVHRLIDPLIVQAVDLGAGLDWKTSLQEIATSESLGLPEYRIEESGPDHAKHFRAQAVVSGEVLGRGQGPSKKTAEQQAAQQAYQALRERGLGG